MPERRLLKARATLPEGYQFGDALDVEKAIRSRIWVEHLNWWAWYVSIPRPVPPRVGIVGRSDSWNVIEGEEHL